MAQFYKTLINYRTFRNDWATDVFGGARTAIQVF